MKNRRKIVDLFAGCGGLSLGFQQAGFEVLGAFEFWSVAAECYGLNFSHPVFREDLSQVNSIISKLKPMQPEVIIGGPPCQDFSNAGNRVEAHRAGLTEAFAQIVSSIHPPYFVMENVDRAEKSRSYARARALLKKAGYGLTEVLLDASFCGVPQKRKRFFCIGSLSDSDDFLLRYIQEHLSRRPMTVRDYFGNTLDFEFYYRHPRNYNRRAVFSIDEPAPTIRGVNRPVPKGYPGHVNDAHKVDSSVRALTTLERALIQTFPADFKWCGSKTDMEQMIGNAVPVKLAAFIGRALQYHISTKEEKTKNLDYFGFEKWLDQNSNFSIRGKRDVLSRLKRAESMLRLSSSLEIYLFRLSQLTQYKVLSPFVKAHLKRGVALYYQYLQIGNLSDDKTKN